MKFKFSIKLAIISLIGNIIIAIGVSTCRMKFKFSIKLAIISLIGNIIIAIGVSTCRISQMGIDPFTSMTTGISGLLNIPLGVFQGSINAVLFLVLIY